MAQQAPRIVREVHDEPHIEGTRISVRHVYKQVHERELHPETVADRHNLDIADVYRALAYYHDHPKEMAEIERNREEILEKAEAETTLTPPDE
jgi:uncharacterized protein (DUF433 family)